MVMKGRLTESEWQRINEFAATPKHRRCPEQLLPESAVEQRDGRESADRIQGD